MAEDLGHLLAFAHAHGPQGLALATVIATWGSSPRPVGSHMLVTSEGDFTGSVSGGCVEGDVLAAAIAVAKGGPAVTKKYGVAQESAWEAGLPCGGEIQILIQPVADHGFPFRGFGLIEQAQKARQRFFIATDGHSGLSVSGYRDGWFNRCYDPPRRMLIIGAVEIARHLATLARAMEIDVTLNDPRAAFLTPARFPGVTHDDRWPDEAVRVFMPGEADAVVTLSHDPKLDDQALLAALGTPAGYIAALGSRRSHATRLARLRAQDARAALDRIQGPAGLSIGAVGPSEIALSILAGAIAAWRAPQPAPATLRHPSIAL